MGCTCSKGVEDAYKIKKRKGSQKFLKKLVSFSQRKIAVEKVGNEDEKSAEPNAAQGEVEDKKLIVFESRVMPQLQRWASMDPILQGEKVPVCGALSVRGGIDGAHIVAGWPFWLTAVAGEAINGWIPRKLESFEKLDKIGQGTYSNVYRAHDLETGKIVALKKVRFCVTDPESVRFMAREILILRRLDHPNVMKLEGVITSRVSSDLYLVFEYMEHDLAGLAASPTIKFTEPQIKCYMQQLLCGLEHCHSRGVLHRDIKGSNLLIDNNGNLKIGDFGLANLSCANQKQPLTSRVVTLWYRPPELLLGSTDYGIGVDLWSSGCILAELFSGKSLLPGRTEVEQLHKIFKLCGSPSEEYWKKSKLPLATFFKPQQPYQRRVSEALKDLLPPSALALVESLLAFEPECRESTTSALQSEFFQAEPLPCDPSSFPKYPPSKQFDAKLQNEEARKRGSLQTGHSMQIGASENLLAIVDEGPNLNSVNAVDFEIHRSQKPRERVAGASHSSQLDFSTESRANCYKLEKCLNTTYKEVNHAESFHHFLGRPDSSDKNNEQVHGKQITMGIAALSMERMVKEHEKQIQIPIRRARIDKNKTRKCFSEDGQTNPLLECISEE